MAKEQTTITGLTVMGILILIYLINQLCKILFKPLLIITIIVFIITIFITIYRSDLALYAWIVVAGFTLLTILAFMCGAGLEKTEIGATLIDAGNISLEAKNALKDSEKQIIDETINATIQDDPNLKEVGEIAKKTIDLV